MNKHFLALTAALVALFVLPNIIWLTLDDVPLSWDQSHHARMSIEFHRNFVSSNFFQACTKAFTSPSYYPPFYYLSSVPILSILGTSDDAIICTQLLYAVVLICGMYLLGKSIAGSNAGLLAVFFAALTPIIYGLSRQPLLDFPLTALVALVLGVACAIQDNPATSWRWIFPLALSAALLTKWTAVLFLFLPLAYLLIRNIFNRQLRSFFLISLFIVPVLVLPWYIIHHAEILKGAGVTFKSGGVEGDPGGLINSIGYQFKILKHVWYMPVLFWCLVPGIAGFFIYYRRKEQIIFLALASLPAAIFFILFPNKDPRYLMPVLPVLIVCVTAGIIYLPFKALRYAVVGSFMLTGLFCFVAYSYFRGQNFPNYTLPVAREDWKIEKIAGTLKQLSAGRAMKIFMLPELPYFNANTLQLSLSRQLVPAWAFPFRLPDSLDDNALKEADVVILKTGKLTVPFLSRNKAEYARKFTGERAAVYGFIENQRFVLPDGSEALLYAKRDLLQTSGNS